MNSASNLKWRGIKTNPIPRHEEKFKTITNRFGQKSITLPRIDDEKRWAGYPGNTGISRILAKIIPDCKIYVEPFAGTAKVFQAILQQNSHHIEKFILNDKSPKVAKWLKKEFKFDDVKITCTDFKHCIKKYDSKDTVFLIDHPWFESYYDQIFSLFDRENVASYDKEVIEICKTIKGKFFITTRKENKRMQKSGFTNFLMKSEYAVSGKYPDVMITTNLPREKLK